LMSKNIESVDIVIPAYMAESTIVRTIRSLLSQKKVLPNIIVVEDGIFDNTQDVLAQFGQHIKLIVLKENKGAQYARNLGLKYCHSEWVMFMDADDIHEGEVLYGLCQSLKKYQADLAFAPGVKRWESGKEVPLYAPNKDESSKDVIIRWLSGAAGPSPCSILWRSKSIRAIGGWNEAYTKNQDGELILRAMFHGLKVSHSKQGMGIYWQHGGERVSGRMDKKAFESKEMLYTYIRQNAHGDQKILNALNYYVAGIAIAALKSGNKEMYKKWRLRWNRTPPKVELIRYHGVKVFLIHYIYFIFGIKMSRIDLIFKRLRDK
jgi:glycosyltransferase involved in cell wall biosynthesis